LYAVEAIGKIFLKEVKVSHRSYWKNSCCCIIHENCFMILYTADCGREEQTAECRTEKIAIAVR
jgi:hypothetical protein